MKGIVNRYSFILLILSILFIAPYKVKAISYDYTLNYYDINIVVNENNTLRITEKIGAYFNVSKHGIFRKIPLRNKVTRLDGTKSSNRAKISDITVSDKYSSSTSDGYKVIQIGDAERTLKGQKDYTISYLYSLGKDKTKDYDELYFNLIGDEWDTTISNITFTITMPKEFDATKLGFSSGKVGSTDSSNASYSVNGNTITGILFGSLKPGEALTIRLELPEGYFMIDDSDFNFFRLLCIVVPIISLLISYFLWYKFGKDDPVVETVEFYPPEGFNSAELGFLYKGYANNKDVVSLIIYLANKGYIKIEETNSTSLFGKKQGFKIVKIKDYDGDNANEALFLDGLFKRKHFEFKGPITLATIANNLEEVVEEDTEATDSSLYNRFYLILNDIIHNINSKANKQKIFEKSTTIKSIIIGLLFIISLFLIIGVPTLDYASSDDELMVTLMFIVIVLPFYMIVFLPNLSTVLRMGGIAIVTIIFIAFLSSMPIKDAVMDNPFYLVSVIIGFICIICMGICLGYMPKRTIYGNQILGKINGFKRFLETAEKQKLEAMVLDNPTYFYDILPYTYVLGVSDKWIEKFESIALQAPNWYSGHSEFNMVTFSAFMSSTMSSATQAMSSSPSSSSSSSGGGSAGGGSGGGGGGSW